MMDVDQVLDCQFGSWYPQFAHLAIRSIIIQLPPAFVEYLVQDGVFVSDDSKAVSGRLSAKLRRTALGLHLS
jgi:hypothetical protein